MQNSYKGEGLLINAFRKEAFKRILLAIGACLFCTVLLIMYKSNTMVNALIIICIAIMIGLIINQIKHLRTGGLPLLTLLKQKPKAIVWVYSVKTQRLPFGVSISEEILLYFKTLNKKEFTVKVKEKELPMIMKFLNQQLPHATFGYTLDNDQWYEANPYLLIKD